MCHYNNNVISVRYYEVDLCKLDEVKSVCARLIDDRCIPNVLLFNGMQSVLGSVYIRPTVQFELAAFDCTVQLTLIAVRFTVGERSNWQTDAYFRCVE